MYPTVKGVKDLVSTVLCLVAAIAFILAAIAAIAALAFVAACLCQLAASHVPRPGNPNPRGMTGSPWDLLPF